MEPEFWLDAWASGRTGFHSDSPHADLERFGEDWLQGATRVLVPLCGKSHDLVWLRDRGIDVVGVELAEQAIRSFAREQDLPLAQEAAAPFVAWRSERLTLLQGNLFDADPDALGRFDRIWDRAALVAVAPAERARYADLLRSLLLPGGSILLNAFIYDQDKMGGPPFSVPEADVRRLYEGLPISILRDHEAGLDARFQERGLSSWRVVTYRIGPVPERASGSAP